MVTLAETVSEHFAHDESQIQLQFSINDPNNLIGSLRTNASVDLERPGAVASGLTAVRGSYGGLLMFTYLSRFVTLGVLGGPATIVVGLLIGKKALKDERARQLAQRRGQAKTALRKYLDELTFQVGKDSRDTVRIIHRQLRDTFTSRADELQRSTSESLQAAQAAVRQDQSTREQRLKELDVEIAKLGQIRARVAQIAPDLAAGAGAGVVAVTNAGVRR